MTDIPPLTPADILNHAWNYFELHAGQRMTLFNYFLLLSGSAVAGLGSTFAERKYAPLGAVLGVLVALISLVFWKLDERTSFLVKHAEEALRILERTHISEKPARLVDLEPSATAIGQMPGLRVARVWTYSCSFQLVFVVMGCAGISGTILSLSRLVGCVAW